MIGGDWGGHILPSEIHKDPQVLEMWDAFISCGGRCLSVGTGNSTLSSGNRSWNRREIEQPRTCHLQRPHPCTLCPECPHAGSVVAVRVWCLPPRTLPPCFPAERLPSQSLGRRGCRDSSGPSPCGLHFPETLSSAGSRPLPGAVT